MPGAVRGGGGAGEPEPVESVKRHTSPFSKAMIRLTRHAAEALEVRGIAIESVTATLETPDWIEIDPRYGDRMRAYKAIAEFGGRLLQVVFRQDGSDMIVTTVHFDRNARP